ncbi:aldo/keto reductase [Streptomyces sp. NPDC090442]|uniref:aldo/keto reductase n=1 Tax=Streptomyces sp. NPDC090442 TaxID=3365962 RepID=UPI003804C880
MDEITFPSDAFMKDDFELFAYRRSGRSGLHLPLLTLGLRPDMGSPNRLTSTSSLLYHALQAGITSFDVTPRRNTYVASGGDELGRTLSVWQAERPELIISARIGFATGFGSLDGFGSRKRILSAVDQLLRRTGLDHLDILYAHRYDPTTPLEETANALATAVHQGKALYTGLSSYAPALADKAAGMLQDLGTPAVACQASYSLLNRWVEEGLLGILEKHGIGCVACAPLHHGDLSQQAFIQPSISDATTDLHNLAMDRGQTSAQLALSWVLREPKISSTLLTTANPTHLLEIVQATNNLSFTPTELAILDHCYPPTGAPS